MTLALPPAVAHRARELHRARSPAAHGVAEVLLLPVPRRVKLRVRQRLRRRRVLAVLLLLLLGPVLHRGARDRGLRASVPRRADAGAVRELAALLRERGRRHQPRRAQVHRELHRGVRQDHCTQRGGTYREYILYEGIEPRALLADDRRDALVRDERPRAHRGEPGVLGFLALSIAYLLVW